MGRRYVDHEGHVWQAPWITTLRGNDMLSSFFVEHLVQTSVERLGGDIPFAVVEKGTWALTIDRLWEDFTSRVRDVGLLFIVWHDPRKAHFTLRVVILGKSSRGAPEDEKG